MLKSDFAKLKALCEGWSCKSDIFRCQTPRTLKARESLLTNPEKREDMNILYSKAAVKAIASMDTKQKKRIKTAIEGIPSGDIKPLRGSNSLYRLRVGQWRIVFSYPDDGTLLVTKIAPRGGTYKGGDI